MRACMERSPFETWDPVQHIFTDMNYLYNKETMTGILQGTGLTAEDLENDPKKIGTKKLTTFDVAYLTKAYDRAHGQDDETATYSILSNQL